ncbi:ABC transporter ATP-binding protein [Alicyclobacillus acidoterrestris]|uniref:ABC transporter ATP-binding protein n=1 Tax=Alicyclobacillus acidoterrestris (strain ATCC 49025 / DSM 3922 / CIP 106132 / NCIMB 13137 / GD3B) TaxID=1356854 RepID=A0A9E6ZST6_ALIAG|nr:ABC transporter ATP-binding protein [Alicyclobacillus acidoterrestris]UNO49835.1 ABC transporter ATP-binding protein [Alicyclobacillus acidoterrestris]
MESAIVLDGVSKRYGDKWAVRDVSAVIEAGTIVALLGPNGAGKTTAMSLMLGLARPTRGTIRILGGNPVKPATRKRIGVMLQQVSLPAKVQVRELIDLFCSYYEQPLDAKLLLEMADLAPFARKEAVKLSGGQQRRLQFALAMAGNPQVLFLDEPTVGMDVSARRGFWEHLRATAGHEGRTIVLTTHHMEETDSIADRVLLMQDGQIMVDGSVEEVKLRAGNRYVSFLAGPTVTTSDVFALPAVHDVTWSGRHVRITTYQPDTVLRAIITQNLDAKHFEISQGQLEDAFLSLMHRSDVDGSDVDGSDVDGSDASGSDTEG